MKRERWEGPRTGRREDPLDALARSHGCMVSDLRLDKGLRRAALRELLEHAEGEYTLEQWQDAVCYLTGVEARFESAAAACRYAQRCLQGKAQER